MTSLMHMNDPMEMRLGIDIIKNTFNTIFPEVTDEINWRGYNNLYYLCCSFSYGGDILSLWRAYSDNGAGVSIGLDENVLSYCNSYDDNNGIKMPNRHSIDKVYYEKKEFEEYIFKYLNDFKNKYGTPSDDNEHKFTRLSKVIHSLYRMSCSFKNSFYKEEKEVRYVVPIHSSLLIDPFFMEDREFDFRLTDYGLSPYSKLALKKKETIAIKQVVLGPKNNSKIEDVELFLFLNGLENVEVKKSNGNYR